MANEGQGARGIDPTLKLSDERLREVFAWLSGEREILDASATLEARAGVFGAIGAPLVWRAITEPTPSELASVANDLLSTRTALAITNETCAQLEAELEAADLTRRSCA